MTNGRYFNATYTHRGQDVLYIWTNVNEANRAINTSTECQGCQHDLGGRFEWSHWYFGSLNILTDTKNLCHRYAWINFRCLFTRSHEIRFFGRVHLKCLNLIRWMRRPLPPYYFKSFVLQRTQKEICRRYMKFQNWGIGCFLQPIPFIGKSLNLKTQSRWKVVLTQNLLSQMGRAFIQFQNSVV